MIRAQLWAGLWFALLVAHVALLLTGRGGVEFAGSVLAVGVAFGFLIRNLRDFWGQA